MGLDDLLGDGEAKPGILAECLMRPVGIETLENSLDSFGRNAWSVVVDDNEGLGLQSPAAAR